MENTRNLEQKTIRLVRISIVPFAFLLYFFNTMDRSNIGFAALRMGESIHMTPVDFGNIVSVFFISYLIFQIPSNIVIQKLGARRWIGTIVIGWGAATMLMFVVDSVMQVMAARFLLGVFEAGFFPGMIFYLASWFPGRERAKVTAWFMLAATASAVIAGPVSGWIVQHFHYFGHEGWRWLFVIEGVPTVLLGFLTFYVLPDAPKDAKWLNDEQRDWLVNELEAEKAAIATTEKLSFRMVVTNPVLWKLAFVYMCVQGANQTAVIWLPSIMKGYNFGISDTEIGFIMAVPFLCAFFTMPLIGHFSDHFGERKWHAAGSMALLAVSFLIISSFPSLTLKIFGLGLFGIGLFGYYGPFWAMPSAMLQPAGLAVSIAFINSCSSLGGFIASKVLGYVSQSYGTSGAFSAMAIMSLMSVMMLVTMHIPRERKKQAEPVPEAA